MTPLASVNNLENDFPHLEMCSTNRHVPCYFPFRRANFPHNLAGHVVFCAVNPEHASLGEFGKMLEIVVCLVPYHDLAVLEPRT